MSDAPQDRKNIGGKKNDDSGGGGGGGDRGSDESSLKNPKKIVFALVVMIMIIVVSLFYFRYRVRSGRYSTIFPKDDNFMKRMIKYSSRPFTRYDVTVKTDDYKDKTCGEEREGNAKKDYRIKTHEDFLNELEQPKKKKDHQNAEL